MMKRKEIILTFDDNDNVVIEVNGVKGKACRDITRDIEAALGTVIETKETAEYRETESKHAARVSAKC